MSLQSNSVAVVTGAASGIGRAVAVRIAEEKIAGVVISDVNEDGLNETAAMIETLSVPVLSHITDVSNLGQVKHLHQTTIERFGRVTHLVKMRASG